MGSGCLAQTLSSGFHGMCGLCGLVPVLEGDMPGLSVKNGRVEMRFEWLLDLLFSYIRAITSVGRDSIDLHKAFSKPLPSGCWFGCIRWKMQLAES